MTRFRRFATIRCFLALSCMFLAVSGLHASSGGKEAPPAEGETELDLGGVLRSIPSRIQLDPPFEIGKHNIGYANPFGALVIGSASGNCNTMALVSRMFYYEGRFMGRTRAENGPRLRRPGFSFAALANRVGSENWGQGTFEVQGYDSLFDMTRSMDIGPNKTSRWVEKECRYRLGLADAPPPEAAPENADALVDVFSLVTTLHYLGSLPNQLAYWIERKITEAAMPGVSTAEINAATVEGAARQLQEGKLPILSMFNGSKFAGHVVLGYRLERRSAQSAVDVFVYDSNVQCGDELDESLIRFHLDTGLMTYMRRNHESGEITSDPIYEGNPWYDNRESLSVQVLPGPDEAEELRPILSETLRNTRLQTGTLFAVGAFLKNLCTRAPAEAPLWMNFRDLVLDMQGVQRRLGERNLGWAPLDPACTVQEFNEFFRANATLATEILFPFILPSGMKVEMIDLSFSGDTGNEGMADVTLRIAEGSSLDEIIHALGKSLVFGGQQPLASLVDRMGSVFAGECIVLRGVVHLEKKAMASNTFAAFAPVAHLRRSHVLIGDLPFDRRTGYLDHRLEISETVLSRMLQQVLEFTGVAGTRAEFQLLDKTLDLGLLGSHTVKRDAYVEFRGLDVSCRPNTLVVTADVGGYVDVATANRGLKIDSSKLETALRIEGTGDASRSLFEVTGTLSSELEATTGLGGLGDSLFELAASPLLKAWVEQAFPEMEKGLETLIGTHLNRIFVLEGETAVNVKAPVVSVASVNLREGKMLPASLSAEFEPFVVDLDATMSRLFEPELALRVKNLEIGEDRLILTIEAR